MIPTNGTRVGLELFESGKNFSSPRQKHRAERGMCPMPTQGGRKKIKRLTTKERKKKRERTKDGWFYFRKGVITV